MKPQQFQLTPRLAGLVLILAAGIVQAGEGISFGVSATRAAVDVSQAGIDIDGDATGYRFFGEYMLTRKFGIEAGFSAYGEPNGTPKGMEVESGSYDVYAVGRYPLGQNFSLIAKAGFVSSNTETEIGDDDETETSNRSTDLGLGLGAQYDFSERFGLRSEVEWVDGVDSGATRLLSLSGVWRFK